MAAVREIQEKMWRAIDGMSKELQHLAQGDADTDGEENVKTMPISNNPIEDRPIPKAVLSAAP